MPLDNPFEPMIKNIGNYVSGTLYGPGVIPPIGITNYDGTALASPADTHLLAAKDPVINEVAVGMTGNLIGENTVTGAPPLQLPNSAGYPLRWLNVALSPYQDLHGYDNPWPAGGGKNKLDSQVVTVGYIRGSNGSLVPGIEAWKCSTDFSPILPDTDYVLYKYATGSSSVAGYAIYDDNKNYIDGDSYGSGSTINITTPQNARYIRASWGANVATPVALMLATETDTSFAPYSNICPILGTDKLNIFVEESYDPAATPKAVIILDNTIYGGTYDAVLGLGMIDRVMWLGSELSWDKIEGSQYRNFVATPINGIAYSNTDITVISSHYKGTANNYASSSDDNYVWANSQQPLNRIAVKDTSKAALTADEFKSAVADVQFVCQLQTSIPFSTDGHSITLLQGNTTIWATSEDGSVDSMSASYIQNE